MRNKTKTYQVKLSKTNVTTLMNYQELINFLAENVYLSYDFELPNGLGYVTSANYDKAKRKVDKFVYGRSSAWLICGFCTISK